MERAVFEVINNKRSIRNVATYLNVKRATLGRYVNKYKNKEIKDVTEFVPNLKKAMVNDYLYIHF